MEKKNNDFGPFVIPMVKAVRIGNYKLWRTKFPVGKGRDKADIDCINVSNLDGSWSVRIPSTMLMYGTVCNGYATADEERRNNFLGMLFTNMYNICTNASEGLHDGFFFLTEMMTFPYLLLPEKEMKRRMEKGFEHAGMDKKAWKAHIAKLLDYRHQLYELMDNKIDRFIAAYEEQLERMRAYNENEAEEDMKHDEIAEEALKIATDETSES